MLKLRSNSLSVTTESRSLTLSESFNEPMDMSAKTTSTDDSSPLVIISDDNDSDNNNSDREVNDYRQNIVHRAISGHFEASLFREPNNNNNNHFDKTDYSPTRISVAARFPDTNENVLSSFEFTPTNHLYACPICGIMSDTQHDFTQHIRGHNSLNDYGNFTCQICHKVLSCSSSLKRHVLVHTGERPYTCEQCPEKFTTNGNLRRHILIHRQREQRVGEIYDSDESTDTFGISSNDSKTINNNSIGEIGDQERKENFQSLDAPQDFSIRKRESETSNEEAKRDEFFAQLDLQNKSTPRVAPLSITDSESNKFLNDTEIEIMKMKRGGEFPCKLCVAVFPNLRALKAHNRIHLSAAAYGPFRCNVCLFSNYDKPALITHMNRHKGDRPFECAVCNYGFTLRANCERHLRNLHGKTSKDEVMQSIIYHPSERSTAGDPVKKKAKKRGKKRKICNATHDDGEAAPIDLSLPLSSLKDISVPDYIESQASRLDQSIEATIDAAYRDKNAVNFVQHRKIDRPISEKNQQISMAQRQHCSERFPNIDPARYFRMAQFYQNLMFPTPGFPVHPLFLQHSLMAHNNELKDVLPKDSPRTPMLQADLMASQNFPPPSVSNISLHTMNQAKEFQQGSSSQESQQELSSSTQRTNLLDDSGPVKMVLKNGVLVPKHKQQRYRTERPFACERCSATFTLRPNRDRHFKTQHPLYWAQQQRYNNITSPTRPQSNSTFEQVNYYTQPLKCRSETSSDYFSSTDSNMEYRSDIDNGNTFPPQLEPDLAGFENSEPKDFSVSRLVAKFILQESKRLKMSQTDSDRNNIASNALPRGTASRSQSKVNGLDAEGGHMKSVSKEAIGRSYSMVSEPLRQTLAPVQLNIPAPKPSAEQTASINNSINSSDSQYKCHLCVASFLERNACLEHIRIWHTEEFSLLIDNLVMAKSDAEQQADDEEKDENRGKYPDYANRKVNCAFCMRRFWSAEDLRRHMRKHSGERPFQCRICTRKFTLKHSMLRHQKQHTNTNPIGKSVSDLSDDEQYNSNNSVVPNLLNIPDWSRNELPLELQNESERKRGDGEETSELIANMLGISDPKILNRALLSTPDEAAKLLGVLK